MRNLIVSIVFVLCPLLASLGVKIGKMSGRGLGFTGGTIDKLEAIKGFNTKLTKQEFLKQLKIEKTVIMSNLASVVPADKVIYDLRDVTATTTSIPLIAASVMSKKIATGGKWNFRSSYDFTK